MAAQQIFLDIEGAIGINPNVSYNNALMPPSREVGRGGATLVDDIAKAQLTLVRGTQGGVSVDEMTSILADTMTQLLEVSRAGQVLAGTPIRENLEGMLTKISPVDTPFRNLLPRKPGASSVSAWNQQVSLGGGFNVSTTVTTGASSTTQTVGSVAGMFVGGRVYFQTAGVYRNITAINSATSITVDTTLSTTTGETVTDGEYSQYNGGAGAAQGFFGETGAPAVLSPSYTKRTATYKLLGTMTSVSGLAMAAGATFGDTRSENITAAINRLLLMEEQALIMGDSTYIYAPFGDGTNALGFDGLLKSIATGNGTPAINIQTSVGALTVAHIDQMLAQGFNLGARGQYIMANFRDVMSFNHLADASGSIIRVQATNDADAVLGLRVTGYKHPLTGEIIPILGSRFVPAGTIIWGAKSNENGNPAADVEVLPLVNLPELAPTTNIQGYVAQELAPSQTSPMVYPTLVCVYETFRMKNAYVFGKSTGVLAV